MTWNKKRKTYWDQSAEMTNDCNQDMREGRSGSLTPLTAKEETMLVVKVYKLGLLWLRVEFTAYQDAQRFADQGNLSAIVDGSAWVYVVGYYDE